MATTTSGAQGAYYGTNSDTTARHDGAVHRPGTETKAAFKTTEFFTYLAAVVGVLIASAAVGTEDGHGDYFAADRAWLYITLLTIGYMISRGLAKSGSRARDER
ncbi:hypothetical protein [Streptomyces sp. DH37]|uniref:hypothetical protein n=1 Tax=Streptomyces sp. DH37 TaxID=3040122 RepID=UPI0024420EFC|nr:hypothetical protein [Streptomyces sp. DH37]MDG9703314.1 hypothetical protein [Streptomyces sp. DH37]